MKKCLNLLLLFCAAIIVFCPVHDVYASSDSHIVIRFITQWDDNSNTGGKFAIQNKDDFTLTGDMQSADYITLSDDVDDEFGCVSAWDIYYSEDVETLFSFPDVIANGSDRFIGWMDQSGNFINENVTPKNGDIYTAVYEVAYNSHHKTVIEDNDVFNEENDNLTDISDTETFTSNTTDIQNSDNKFDTYVDIQNSDNKFDTDVDSVINAMPDIYHNEDKIYDTDSDTLFKKVSYNTMMGAIVRNVKHSDKNIQNNTSDILSENDIKYTSDTLSENDIEQLMEIKSIGLPVYLGLGISIFILIFGYFIYGKRFKKQSGER